MRQRQEIKENARMERVKSHKRRRQNRAGLVCISFVAMLLLTVVSIQIMNLTIKNKGYIQAESQLQKEVQAEQDREQEIKEYEKYMQSDAYIEEIAQSKLGLVKKNEVVFKEKNN